MVTKYFLFAPDTIARAYTHTHTLTRREQTSQTSLPVIIIYLFIIICESEKRKFHKRIFRFCVGHIINWMSNAYISSPSSPMNSTTIYTLYAYGLCLVPTPYYTLDSTESVHSIYCRQYLSDYPKFQIIFNYSLVLRIYPNRIDG